MRRLWGWSIRALVAALPLVALYLPSHGAELNAAPYAGTPSWYDPGNRFEVRFGGFAHGVGSRESGTFDLNAEFVTPRLPFGFTGVWNVLTPRVHIGGMGNLSGRTSAAYAGFLWTIPVWDRVFIEGFGGGALHNGSRTGTATLEALGCNPLFHVGGSVGYQFNERWNVMFTFDHLSNGKWLFGTDCNRNKGANNYGARIGYAF